MYIHGSTCTCTYLHVFSLFKNFHWNFLHLRVHTESNKGTYVKERTDMYVHELACISNLRAYKIKFNVLARTYMKVVVRARISTYFSRICFFSVISSTSLLRRAKQVLVLRAPWCWKQLQAGIQTSALASSGGGCRHFKRFPTYLQSWSERESRDQTLIHYPVQDYYRDHDQKQEGGSIRKIGG